MRKRQQQFQEMAKILSGARTAHTHTQHTPSMLSSWTNRRSHIVTSYRLSHISTRAHHSNHPDPRSICALREKKKIFAVFLSRFVSFWLVDGRVDIFRSVFGWGWHNTSMHAHTAISILSKQWYIYNIRTDSHTNTFTMTKELRNVI